MRAKKRLMGEINVTPLVDVILVLLIIFIITAPMITTPGVDIDLPVASSKGAENASEKQIIVTITKDSEIFLQDKPVKLEDLDVEIKKTVPNENSRIFIRGDKQASYELIVKTLVLLKGLKHSKISLVTEPED